MLLIVEALVFVWTMFGYGMDGWAAQGRREKIDEAALANIAFMRHFLIAYSSSSCSRCWPAPGGQRSCSS